MATRWLRVPYTLMLVIVGLIISPMHFLPSVHISPELILLIFLPALLFDAAWNLKLDALKKNLLPIFMLAVPGVILSVGVIGLVLNQSIGLPWQQALLFGAVISATDPVSVLALFKKLGLPTRLATIVEGESLFNDGTSVIVFRILLGIIAGTTAGSVGSLIPTSLSEFCIVMFGGIAVGAVVGLMLSTVTSYFNDHLLEITLTTIAAYGSFLSAEAFHVSPVIAVLIAGLIIGNYGRRTGMSPTTQVAVNSFWEYAAFVVNSLVFLLIGLEIQVSMLAQNIVPILWGILAMLAARMLAVYGLGALTRLLTETVPLKWQHVLFWGGLRGSLSLALVLSLPKLLPGRSQLVVMVFGVILFSLLVQGLTVTPLLKWLNLAGVEKGMDEHDLLQGRLLAETAALAELEGLRSRGTITDRIYEQLRTTLIQLQENLSRRLVQSGLSGRDLHHEQLLRVQKHLIDVKKARLAQLRQEGILSETALHELINQLDEELGDIQTGPAHSEQGDDAKAT